MPSFKATDAETSKPAWLTAAQKTDCHGADAAETGSSGLVMHQGWTVPQGGNDNVLAQRETLACMNMTSDIGAGDDGIWDGTGGGGGGGTSYSFVPMEWTDRPQSAADYPSGGVGAVVTHYANQGPAGVEIMGTYTGTPPVTVQIEITMQGTVQPDEFKWNITAPFASVVWTTQVSMASGPMPLADGITVMFGMAGMAPYVIGDSWYAVISAPSTYTTQTYPLTDFGGVSNPDDQSSFLVKTMATHAYENPPLTAGQMKLSGGDWYHGVQGSNDDMVPVNNINPLPRPTGWMVSDNNVFKQMDPTESYKCATPTNPFPFTATLFLESQFAADGTTPINYPGTFMPIEYPAGASVVVPFFLEYWQDAAFSFIPTAHGEPAAITFTVDAANIDTTQTYWDTNWAGGDVVAAFISSFLPSPTGGNNPYVWQIDTPPAIPEYISYGYRDRSQQMEIGAAGGYLNYFDSQTHGFGNGSFIELTTATDNTFISTLTIKGGSSVDHNQSYTYGLWDDYAIILGHATSLDGRNPNDPYGSGGPDLPLNTRITLEILPPDNGYSTWPTVPTTLDCVYSASWATSHMNGYYQTVSLIVDDRAPSSSVSALNLPAGQLAIAQAWADDLNTTQTSAMSASNVKFRLKGTAWTP